MIRFITIVELFYVAAEAIFYLKISFYWRFTVKQVGNDAFVFQSSKLFEDLKELLGSYIALYIRDAGALRMHFKIRIAIVFLLKVVLLNHFVIH